MLPTIDIFDAHIHSYNLMGALGLIAALVILPRFAQMRNMRPYSFIGALPKIAVCTVVGATILYGLTNVSQIRSALDNALQGAPLAEVALQLLSAFDGFVFYGGVLGALSGLLWWCRATGNEQSAYLDLFALGVPLFHAFARIGCFLGGCCFGIESNVGFVYTESPIALSNGSVRFPVQLLESACEALLFGVIAFLFSRNRLKGQLVWVWFGSYAVVRFLDEFLRGDYYRGFIGPLSTSQFISVCVLCVVFIHLVKRFARVRQGVQRLGCQRASGPNGSND